MGRGFCWVVVGLGLMGCGSSAQSAGAGGGSTSTGAGSGVTGSCATLQTCCASVMNQSEKNGCDITVNSSGNNQGVCNDALKSYGPQCGLGSSSSTGAGATTSSTSGGSSSGGGMLMPSCYEPMSHICIAGSSDPMTADQCMAGGGTPGCPAAGLIGCCRVMAGGFDGENCYYMGGAIDAQVGQANCKVQNGTWSQSP